MAKNERLDSGSGRQRVQTKQSAARFRGPETEPYRPDEVAARWQQRWSNDNVFVTTIAPDKPRFYGYEYPPFPSGSLHMGHVRNYVIGDAMARYKRLQGFSVLYVQAFDSLGLPVEDAARGADKSPEAWLDECIAEMTSEMLGLGLSYDTSRFFSYHDPAYYKWTQWLFLRLYEAGAIYLKQTWADWCAGCETALASELVDDGGCWRCGTPISKRELSLWYLDVQSIADDLLEGLKKYNVPDNAKAIQQGWIGKTEGVVVPVEIEDCDAHVDVFVGRPSVLCGATYLGVAPENPIVDQLLASAHGGSSLVDRNRSLCTMSRVERRKSPGLEGIFVERYAIHPITQERLPIYVVPFLQPDRFGGARFGVPAHDTSDFRFAESMALKVLPVIRPEDRDLTDVDMPYTGEGTLTDSGVFSGQTTHVADQGIRNHLLERANARIANSFRVRDWCISRQRYWSAPIPIVHCVRCGPVPVADGDLPVELPTSGVDIGVPGNPLEHHEGYMVVSCPRCGASARRESSTLDTFFNSSWSYLRYCNPHHDSAMFDPEAVRYWVPCDFDIGGTENITVANFYFRIVLKWLHRLEIAEPTEPFASSIFHGMVMKDGQKMSKSLGNTVKPAELIHAHGVDAVRFDSMSAARPKNDYNWSGEQASNSERFLRDVWTVCLSAISLFESQGDRPPSDESLAKADTRFMHQHAVAVDRIEAAYDSVELQAVCKNLVQLLEKLNTYVTRTHNRPTAAGYEVLRNAVTNFIIMINPIAPHISEELWARLGHDQLLASGEHWREVVK